MIKLTDQDFELMNPGELFKFGETKVFVKPLAPFSDEFKRLYCELKELETDFKAAGITIENFPYKLPQVVKVILEKSQSIVELLMPLEPEDIKKLPVHILKEYFDFFIKLNEKSVLGMEKNSNSWAEVMGKTARGVTLIFSMFSSAQDTEKTKLKDGQPVKSVSNSEPLSTVKATDMKNTTKK